MLPLAGGLFDQPGLYLAKMEQILEARAEKELRERQKAESATKLEERAKSGI